MTHLVFTFTMNGRTHTVQELPNDRLHVYQRGSGLQGSMERNGTDGPSWLRPSEANTLAQLFRVKAMGTPE